MNFDSLERRMAMTYLDTFPAFMPSGAGISEREQEAFYQLIKGLYKLAFDEPLLFVAKLHEDDAYPNRFNKTSYGKPDLIIHMRKFTKAVDEILLILFAIGRGETPKQTQRQTAIRSRLGLGESDIPAGLRWMATRPGADIVAFSHCFFDENYPYASDIYARLLGEGTFRTLENWMIGNGYTRHIISDVTASDCKISLTYANPKWSPMPPGGGFEYRIRHTGVSVRYDAFAMHPPVLGLCVPNMKDVLLAFEKMGDALKTFVIQRTRVCEGCRYCVQTDQTGTRPTAAIPVTHDGKPYSLCPYFPGYSYCWEAIEDELAGNLIAMLSFVDGMLGR